MTGMLIAIFLGWAGGYRFYKKQFGLGVLYFFTFGIFCIGWFADIFIAIRDCINKIPPKNIPTYTEPPVFTPPQPAPPDVFFIHSSKDTEKNIGQLKERFIVVDTETSGLDSTVDRILSIAAIIYENGDPVQQFYTLINQPVYISPEATAVNGITSQMLQGAPSEQSAMTSFAEFCGDALKSKTLLVAFNSSFDFRFIKKAMDRCGIAGNVRHFDVLSYSRKNIAELKNYKQVTVAKHLGIDTTNAHNALADCRMCANILLKLLERQ